MATKGLKHPAFPWWYGWVKWVLPLVLAILASSWSGLTLTGIWLLPPALSMLNWGPMLFSTLEGFSSLAALTVVIGAVASMVGIASALLVRGLILFHINERSAIEARFTINTLTHELEHAKKSLENLEKKSSDNQQIFEKFNQQKENTVNSLLQICSKFVGAKPIVEALENQTERPKPSTPRRGRSRAAAAQH